MALNSVSKLLNNYHPSQYEVEQPIASRFNLVISHIRFSENSQKGIYGQKYSLPFDPGSVQEIHRCCGRHNLV